MIKKIRFFLMFFIFTVLLILEVELFQIDLSNYGGIEYRSSFIDVEADKIEEFIKKVTEASISYDVECFFWIVEIGDNRSGEIHIYASQEAQENIEHTIGISEKNYRSFASGELNIEFYDIKEILNENNPPTEIYFCGNDKNIDNLYYQLKQEYEINYPVIMESSDTGLIYGCWALSLGMMLVLTIMDVVARKKEIVVRMSFGESVTAHVVKDGACSLALDLLAYGLARVLVFNFVSGQYSSIIPEMIALVGMLLSTLLYCGYFFFDVKKAFANAQNQAGLLTVAYIAKGLVSVIVLIGASIGCSLVVKNISMLKEVQELESLNSYTYVRILDSDEDVSIEEATNNLYWNYYESCKPIICAPVYEDQCMYYLVNEYGELLIRHLFNEEITGEMVVLIPEEYEIEAVIRSITEDFGLFFLRDVDAGQIEIQTIKYKGSAELTYVDGNTESGIGRSSEGVIIYIPDSEMSKSKIDAGYFTNSVLFNMSKEDKTKFENTMEAEKNDIKLVYNEFSANTDYYRDLYSKLIILASCMCAFLLIVQLCLDILVVKLEYQVRANMLAIKKTLGYGIIEKNRRTILVCIGLDFLFVAMSVILVKILKLGTVHYCIFMGLIILVMEMVVCLAKIIQLERESILKILKGGCL